MPALRNAVLIYNPRAGRWRAEKVVRRLAEILREAGFRTDPRATAAPGHATELAGAAVREGTEAVFCYGGDGTLRETAEGLLGTEIPLGPLPGGTANVICHSLGLPRSPHAAAAAHAGTRPTRIDVGLCSDQHFLMQASFGLDARTLRRIDLGWKRLIGRTAIALEGFRQWATYDYPDLRLRIDDDPVVARFAAVCNLPHYGGRWVLAPGADPTDGRLDLVLFRGSGRWRALAFSGDVMLGRHTGRPDVELRRVEKLTVEGPADLEVQLDGDSRDIGPPFELRLARRRLTVLAPESTRF